ncbi:DEKNAAC102923 [Brettanomyces naardenensis]|uniref:DEKNAAC102923 n=1 Tax=Brettanomyces naardenensis TaxID=13370 RepID=A0A448YLU9_BRENA|nr:DEKNAAC102923 [Brettanomyces naardenensis]
MSRVNLTSIHVSDLARSVKFYSNALGFKEVHRLETPSYISAVIELGSQLPENSGRPLNQRNGLVELRQNKDGSAKIYNGNTDPYRGFGHLCVSVSNIVEAQKHLLKEGVTFKKRLEDGRQKDIAFIQDPDTYWIELIENAIDKEEGKYNVESNRLNHTMIRVKDPKKSLEFYQGVLGLKVYDKKDFEGAKFTLYFLGSDDGRETKRAERQSLIELTHNWGSESDDSKYYVPGKDKGVIGFDHFTISVGDVQKFDGVKGKSEDPELLETVLEDPDGWRVHLVDEAD